MNNNGFNPGFGSAPAPGFNPNNYSAPQGNPQVASMPGFNPAYGFTGNPWMGGNNWAVPPTYATATDRPVNMPMNSSLSPERQAALTKEHGVNFFTPPKNSVEYDRYICNHHTHDGHSALKQNDDGTCTCNICGTSFHYIEPSSTNVDNIRTATEQLKDIWETIKVNWGPINPEIAQQLYSFGSVIDQIPNMWKQSSDYIKRMFGVETPQYGPYDDNNVMRNLYTIINGAPMNYGYGAPVYGNPMGGDPNMMGYGYNGAPAYGAPNYGVNPNMPSQATGWGQPATYNAPQAPQAPQDQAQQQAAPAQEQPQAAPMNKPAYAPIGGQPTGMPNPIGQQEQNTANVNVPIPGTTPGFQA